MSIPVRSAAHLRAVGYQIQFWQLAAAELPIWIPRVLETAREYVRDATGDGRAAAMRLVAALETFDADTIGGQHPPSSAVRVLWSVLVETYSAFADAPDRENPRSLAMARHSLVNVLAPLNLASPEFLTQKLQAAIEDLGSTYAPLRADLQNCIAAVEKDVAPNSVQLIKETLEKWHGEVQQALPPETPRFSLIAAATPIRAALIIEDQWWGDVLEQKVRVALPAAVKVWRVRTLQEALGFLDKFSTGSPLKAPPPASAKEGSAEHEGDLLVFLDLGLPEDAAALREGHISRAHGKQLLVRLRDYGVNARTVVLTSPSEYLPDHLWISQQGIAPEDFILKTDLEWDKEIDDALRRTLEQGRTIGRVELDEENGVAWLDGIEVRFVPMDFKIVSILCETLKDKPQPQRRRRAFSCAEIAGHLTNHAYEGCEPENIPSHIHTIRRRLHERFNEVGRSINAHRVIATEFYGDEARYRIVAGQFLRRGQKITPVVSAVTVLVVEDNEAWRNAIAEPLREAGYEVETAADVAAALATAQQTSPTVVCVDMQLPASAEAASEDVDTAGDEEGGLRVIERVRDMDAEARIVVLTDLAQQDRLRVEAARRGVSIHDYIHKADPAWLWKLHRSIWRLTREWQQGIDLSEGATREGHVVELSRSNQRSLWVDGVDIPLSKTRAKLVHALAEHVDQRISKDDLQAKVYADKKDGKDRSGALPQIVNDVRNQIESDARDASRKVNAKHIIVEESGGYMLCGPVIYRN